MNYNFPNLISNYSPAFEWLIEKAGQPPAHQNQQNTYSLIRTVWNKLQRFVNWLLGRKSEIIVSEELKLRYAMHIFHTFDPSLLTIEEHQDVEFPLWRVLEARTRFLKEYQNELIYFDELLPQLEETTRLAKKLHEARKFSASKRKQFVKEIHASLIQKLDENERICLPCGVLHYHEINKARKSSGIKELSNLPVHMSHFFCDLFKLPNSSYAFNIYDSSDAKGHINEYEIPADEIQNLLKNLLEVQTAPHEHYREDLWSIIKHGWKIAKNLVSPDRYPLPQDFRLGISTLKFNDLINKIKPWALNSPRITICDPRVKTTAERALSFYINSKEPFHAEFLEMGEKLILFLEIYEICRHRLNDPSVKKWLYATALSLLKELKHNRHLFHVDGTPTLKLKIEEIVNVLKESSFEREVELPGVMAAQIPSSSQFHEPFQFKEELISLNSYRKALRSDIKTIDPLMPIDFTKDFNEVIEGLKEWDTICFQLSRKSELETLSYLLNDIQNYLLKADEANFWERIPVIGPDLKPLKCLDNISAFLYQIIAYQIQVHFGMKKPGPLPNQILHFLKNLERCQKLVHLDDAKNCFGNFALDMNFFKEILKDAWLDLDCYGPEIYATLNRIEGGERRLVNFTVPSQLEQQSENDRAFYLEFHNRRGLKSNLVALPEDFGSLLTPSLVNLRKIKILLTAVMARHHVLGNPKLTKVIPQIIRISWDYYRNKISDYDNEFLSELFDAIDEKLHNRRLPGQMSVTRYSFFDQPVIQLDPYGVSFFQPQYTYNDNYGPPFNFVKIGSQYKTTAQEVLPEIAYEVIEGSIACDSNGYADENGLTIAEEAIPANKHCYVPPGKQSTEGSVIHESESLLGIESDIWADIRMMKTAPLGTRIPNTLTLFIEHPHLLTHEHYGLSFQRVFRLNFFRGNAFANFIELYPHQLPIIEKDLISLEKTYLAKNDIEGRLFIQTVSRDVAFILKGRCPALLRRVKNFDKLLGKWQKSCDGSTILSPYKRAIYHNFLLLHTQNTDQIDDELLIQLLKSYFHIRQIQEPAQARNRCYEDQIHYFIHQIIPKVEQLAAESPALLDELLNSLTGMKQGKWERTDQKLCFVLGNIEVDLIDGQIYIDDIAKTFLPDAITHDPICRELFENDHIFTVHAEKEKIYFERSRGQKYKFTYNQHEFQIYLLPGYRRFIYKLIDDQWYQLSELDNSESTSPNSKSLPQQIYDNYFWRSLNKQAFVVETKSGERLFSGEIEEETDTILTIEDKNNLQVLNPWAEKEYARFLSISPQNRLYALGHLSPLEVIYEAFELSYKWNEANRKWMTPQYEGYYLSIDPLEPCIYPHTIREAPGSFFDLHFKNFHLLKHPSKTPIVLISDFEYIRPTRIAEERRTGSIPVIVENQSHNTLYAFEIDLQIGLKSKSPEGYLYLAYILFVQGKYDVALNYIEKARGINPSDSVACQRILNLFEKWPAKSNNATIVRLHLGLLALLNTSPNLRGQSNYTSLTAQLQNLMALIDKYNSLHSAGKVPHNLLITNKQKRGLLNILNSTEITFPAMANLVSSALSNVLNSKIHDKLHVAVNAAQAPLRQFADNSTLLRTHLDNEILFLRKSLKTFPSQGMQTPSVTVEIFPETFLDGLVPRQPKGAIGSLDKLMDHLKTIPDLYTRELTEEIFHDVLIDISASNLFTFPDQYDFHALLNLSRQEQEKLENEILAHIVAMHKLLLKPTQIKDTIKLAINILKNNQENKDHYINKLIYACATDEWEDLVSSKIIDMEKVDEIKTVVQTYLIHRTQLQQCQKLVSAITAYLENSDLIQKERVATILLQKRFYDPVRDPLRFYLLLLENEQKVIATESQVEHYKSFFLYKDIFKHEALAGGKTAILRNLIAAMYADGFYLATNVTADTLIDRHHPLFKHTTEEAYGKRCLRIEFSRNSPSDGISLRIILRNLLSAIVNKYRIDLTRRDGLSLRHAYLLKLEEAVDEDERYFELQDEIEILSQILVLLKQNAAANTDEMDAVTTPLIEHNYALGEPRPLSKMHLDFFLPWMETILTRSTHARLKQLILSNEQYKLSWADIESWYVNLSFERKRIIQHAFSQRNNVHYTRSSDGYSVKPTLVTDFGIVPNELSEFGTEEETILYTLINYIQDGVSPQQIESIVIQEQKKASDELLRAIKEKERLTYETTAAAIEFKMNFDIELINVSPADYAKIAFEIKIQPKRLIQFLENHVFPRIRLCDRKLSGSSYDFVNLFRHFSGSSGTSNSYRAFPTKICHFLEFNKGYRRQPGVDGATIAAIMNEFDRVEDVICVDQTTIEGILSTVASHLKQSPGATLIDASPLFPQMTSIVLATELANHLEGCTIRYYDNENNICFINKPNRESVDLANVITILVKGQDRGTDLVMSDRSIGYVTLNKTTSFTEFMQAAKRMRKLGKGQKIRFLVDTETAELTKHDPTFISLLIMLLSNETEQMKKIYSKAEHPKVLAAGTSVLLQLLTHTHHPKLRGTLWEKVKHFFITDYDSEPLPPRTLALNLKAIITDLYPIHVPILHEIFDEGLDELEGYINGDNLLPSKYLSQNGQELRFGSRHETQTALEYHSINEHELEIQTHQAPKGPYQSLPYHHFNIDSVKQLVKQTKTEFIQLSDCVNVYDSSIFLSPNLYNPNENSTPWGQDKYPEGFPQKQMKFSRMAIIISNDTVRSFIGTHKDFDLFFYPLDKKRAVGDLYYLYNLEKDVIEGGLNEWPANEFFRFQIISSIVQAKHLSGICRLTKEQKPVFERWLSEIDNLKALETNLMRFLQAVRPSQYPHYPSSDMGLIYQEVLNTYLPLSQSQSDLSEEL